MKTRVKLATTCAAIVAGLAVVFALAGQSSYAPVVITEDFDATVARMSAAKPDLAKRQMDLLKARYDLSDSPAKGVAMS